MKIKPKYLSWTLSTLQKVKEKLNHHLDDCQLCPRQCAVNRTQGQRGFCQAGSTTRLGNYMVHKGEEPAISGLRGSGAVFFAHCPLQCCYCQNYPFSQEHTGTDYSVEDLASIYLWLQEQGSHNINWVSPTPFLPQAFSALLIAREKGLRIPLIWNTSGWETKEIMEISRYFCDVYLMDARYSNANTALQYSKAKDYPTINTKCIQIARQIEPFDIWEEDLLVRGLIMRLLVLPSFAAEAIDILHTIHRTIGNETLISLMSQYFPTWKASLNPPLDRILRKEEFEEVRTILLDLQFENGWIQEL